MRARRAASATEGLDAMKKIILTLACLSLLVPAAAAQQKNDLDDIEATIAQFWSALGKLDARQLKASLDWPCSIIEATATDARPAVVLRNEAEFDEEFKRSAPDADKKTESEFAGTRVTDLKVNKINDGLACATYLCLFPQKGGREQKTFSAITVLRRNPQGSWKIILVNVPK
jgi:ketosteroid isomerase-like protein